MSKNIVIATIRPWNLSLYKKWKPPTGYKKHLISSPEKLTFKALKRLDPKFIFFPHWSWIVSPEIYENFECVIFHETDLPFGRGGSPIQNLLVRGIYKTKITALRAVQKLDAGPVYLKRSFDMSNGSALEIFQRISKDVFEMISEITKKNPKPQPQKDKPVFFKRRRPEESRIPENLSGRALYDFIRMLDAPGYPKAFIDLGRELVEFSDASLQKDHVSAKAKFRRTNNKG